ncbi:glial cell line-derived neurotrophic factor [Megalops cyprinoides]|uniref:glial cell line-derived neurotrophic factor n=1 Tax=Megalops cyprinoides TaxID=118141 RepID=UPI001863D6FC|nr:glial cell line-derived neurotrophic factor [Megalops cyprinoides]
MLQSLQSAKTSYLQEQLGFPSVLLEEPEFVLESKIKPGRLQGSTTSEKEYDIAAQYPETLKDVVDFLKAAIGRQRRSSEQDDGSQRRKEWNRSRETAKTGGGRKRRRRKGRQGQPGRGRRKKGRQHELAMGLGHGCQLKQIHLKVMDLGLGYRTQEELIFKYCSGPCVDAETNYDKILNTLIRNKKLDQDVPSRTCCRPIAFDDDLSFLDDSLVYHVLKKHSAKRCGCV